MKKISKYMKRREKALHYHMVMFTPFDWSVTGTAATRGQQQIALTVEFDLVGNILVPLKLVRLLLAQCDVHAHA